MRLTVARLRRVVKPVRPSADRQHGLWARVGVRVLREGALYTRERLRVRVEGPDVLPDRGRGRAAGGVLEEPL